MSPWLGTTAARLRVHALALMTLIAVRLLLARLGVEGTLRVASFLGRPCATREGDVTRVVRAVRRTGRRLPGAACLAQSITVAGLLGTRPGDLSLVLGCQLTPHGWTAHAWVDCDGDRLEPVPGGSHVELARYRWSDGWRISTSAGAAAAVPTCDEAPNALLKDVG